MKKTAGVSAPVSAEELASISSPDRVETPFGVFEFFDGLPLPSTVDRAYDALDLLRAVDVFLNCVPGASMLAMRNGLRSVGIDESNKLAVTDPRADSAQLMLTANTVTTYGTGFLDLRRDGPTVIEAPPNSLSFVDDAWQRYVADMGIAGPDKGEGGKYLFLPPDYEGEVPDGYFVAHSPTYSNWIVIRALSGIESLETTRIYPLARADSPPEMDFINIARVAFNGTHSNDFSFFEEINTIVQEEPSEALDPERAGQIASIGIAKGQPFAPDERLYAILETGARVAAGLARTLLYKPRDPRAYYYPDGSWKNAFVGGSYEFLSDDGARLLDMRAMMHYVGTGITPAMTQAHVGVGSQYAFTAEDASGDWLDGANDYTLRLPAGIPAKTFWSIDIYDTQTRALLQTDNPWPSINSFAGDAPVIEVNGDVLIHFSPRKPDDENINWLQTIPGKGWFTILRLYGPLEPWFDKTWRPGEVARVN